MSAIAAFVGDAQQGSATLVSRMLEAMAARGTDSVLAPTSAGDRALGALGISTHSWERALHADAATVARSGQVTVVADATLYHADDLRRALGAGAPATPEGAAGLVLAAYHRWGAQVPARLEGDFAFILWDGAEGLLLAARDFAGHRPLFFAERNGMLWVASTVDGILADMRVPRTLDHATLASVAAGLWNHSPLTAYAAIAELQAGQVLRWRPSAAAKVHAFWRPPDAVLTTRQPMAAAAEELRVLLVEAVRERLAPSGVTAVSLSGGWDSTAVYGAGRIALRGGLDDARLRPVSVSYPEGDPGREDPLIRAVLAPWNDTTTWLEVDAIPLFDDAERASGSREEPFAHAYEPWNRAITRGARSVGARVVLDGVGGDQLFQVSDVYLSDLFRRGRWIELSRQWRGRGGTGVRAFYRWAVRPALPDALTRAVALVRGMSPAGRPFDRRAPFWFRQQFLASHGVMERERDAAPRLPTHDAVLAETHLYLRYPFFGRICAQLGSFALAEGAELRSPLLDERVVRFAAGRPWSERVDGGETKILLRRAMRGVLPDEVLAARAHRTGITSAYFLRQLRGPGRTFVERMMEDPLLGSLGMIDPSRLRSAWEHVLRHDDDEMGVRVFFTIQVEAWLRARRADEGPST